MAPPTSRQHQHHAQHQHPKAASIPGARQLQDNIHDLLTRLAETIEHVKQWPAEATASTGSGSASSKQQQQLRHEEEDNAVSVHVESTTKLITKIRLVIASLERVESFLKPDNGSNSNNHTLAVLQKALASCQIPLDLLDVLDSSSIHPDCFNRGLLREAVRQLAGLKRRKLALESLGSAVQIGMQKKLEQSKKRQRQEATNEVGDDYEAMAVTKKQKTESPEADRSL